MAFSSSSVIVLTDTGAVHDFQTGQSSPVSVSIPAGSAGTWTWVVSRAGYTAQVGTFDTAGGGVESASPTPSQRLQPSGAPMYTGTSAALVAVSFDLATPGSERCFVDIGDGTADPQVILNEVEDALTTEDGCRFLAATSGSECTFTSLAAGSFLFMGTGYRLRRASTGDVNAAVGAFVISVDGAPVDGLNGSVAFLSAGLSAEDVAAAVWNALEADHLLAGSFGQLLTATKASADFAGQSNFAV